MEVKVNVTPCREEYMKLNFYHLLKRMVVWSAVLTTLIIGLHRKVDFAALCAATEVVVIWILIVVPITFLRSRREWKTNLSIKQLCEYTITNASVCAKSANGFFDLGYDKVFKIRETPTAFYVYLSSHQAFIVPKRCFENPDDIRAVRGLFLANVDKKKLKLLTADENRPKD